jgi:hypothetical protein
MSSGVSGILVFNESWIVVACPPRGPLRMLSGCVVIRLHKRDPEARSGQ